MFFMWKLTVCSERQSEPAISLFVAPSATSRSTSRSRGVRSSRWSSLAAGSRPSRTNSSRILAASRGDRAGSPAERAFSFDSRSDSDMSLSKYPSAPLLIASKRSSSWSETVTIAIRVSGSSALISRVASRPLHSGIVMSIRTRSGCSLRTSSRASRPLPASPTTSCPHAWSRLAIPARKSAWSSASTRRMRHLPRLGHGQRHRDARPRSRLRLHLEVTADRLGPLAHRLQTKARPAGPCLETRFEALPVVRGLDHQDAFVERETDRGVSRSRVLTNIRQGFLHDPHELDLDCGLQLERLDVVVGVEAHAHPGHRGVLLEVAAQCGHESLPRQRHAQAEDGLADVAVHVARCTLHRIELAFGCLAPSSREQPLDSERLRVDVAEHLSQSVVQLAGYSDPFLEHGPVEYSLVQPRVRDRERDPLTDAREQPELAIARELLRVLRGDSEHANDLAAVLQGQPAVGVEAELFDPGTDEAAVVREVVHDDRSRGRRGEAGEPLPIAKSRLLPECLLFGAAIADEYELAGRGPQPDLGSVGLRDLEDRVHRRVQQLPYFQPP